MSEADLYEVLTLVSHTYFIYMAKLVWLSALILLGILILLWGDADFPGKMVVLYGDTGLYEVSTLISHTNGFVR
jgi:hypothetical protein